MADASAEVELQPMDTTEGEGEVTESAGKQEGAYGAQAMRYV